MKKLPTTDDEHIYPADTCGAAHDVRLALMQRFFKDVGVLTDAPSHLNALSLYLALSFTSFLSSRVSLAWI